MKGRLLDAAATYVLRPLCARADHDEEGGAKVGITNDERVATEDGSAAGEHDGAAGGHEGAPEHAGVAVERSEEPDRSPVNAEMSNEGSGGVATCVAITDFVVDGNWPRSVRRSPGLGRKRIRDRRCSSSDARPSTCRSPSEVFGVSENAAYGMLLWLLLWLLLLRGAAMDGCAVSDALGETKDDVEGQRAPPPSLRFATGPPVSGGRGLAPPPPALTLVAHAGTTPGMAAAVLVSRVSAEARPWQRSQQRA